LKRPDETIGSGANSNQERNEAVHERDSAKIPRLPGSKTKATVQVGRKLLPGASARARITTHSRRENKC
jgi:hypothetical protein